MPTLPEFPILAEHPEMVLFACLGLGYLLGRVRIGSFTLGPTIGTLLVSLAVGMLAPFNLSGQLKTVFFCLFAFVLGYESGPAFFASLRSSGAKTVLLAMFYAAVVLVMMFAIISLSGLDRNLLVGMVSGAQTQTSILGLIDGGSAAPNVAYTLCYVFGVTGVILFMKKAAPPLLGIDLKSAVKARIDAAGGQDIAESSTLSAAVQVRAYTVTERSPYAGRSIRELEVQGSNGLQIEQLHRGGAALDTAPDTVVHAGDVITVIGSAGRLNAFDDAYLEETTDPEYLKLTLAAVDVIVICGPETDVTALLDRHDVLLRSVMRRGRRLTPDKAGAILQDDRLQVTGPTHAVKALAREIGYIRDTGDASDIPFLMLAMAVGVLAGSLYLMVAGVRFSLGASTGALLLGLISGWLHQRNPRMGRIPSGARWFLKSVGMNVFIATAVLNSAWQLRSGGDIPVVPLLLIGAAATLIPHFISLFFGKYVLKMDPIDIIGGLCGAGTCTPAVTAVSEETNSTVFASSYSTGSAAGNILLTIVGMLLTL